jgi:2-amino-4-hydroxy-6-hydroxymethyldihydropteridine diphosphokinase
MRTVAVALGSNLPFEGEPSAVVVARAARALDARSGGPIHDPRLSRLYLTEPVVVDALGPPGGPKLGHDRPGHALGGSFVNAVVAGRASLDPPALLAQLHEIEARFGRDRTLQPHGAARTLDLDLLLVGELVIGHGAWADGASSGASQSRAMLGRVLVPLRVPHAGLLALPGPTAATSAEPARLFVLAPLADVLPEVVVPVIGRRVGELAALARAVFGPSSVRTIPA